MTTKRYSFSRRLSEPEADLLVSHTSFKDDAKLLFDGESLTGCVAREEDVRKFERAVKRRLRSRKLEINEGD